MLVCRFYHFEIILNPFKEPIAMFVFCPGRPARAAFDSKKTVSFKRCYFKLHLCFVVLVVVVVVFVNCQHCVLPKKEIYCLNNCIEIILVFKT